jgi:molybdopterin adenylyltransferase
VSADQHRAEAQHEPVEVHVVTVSSTRAAEDDPSGDLVAELLEAAGHRVVSRAVVDDDRQAIVRAVGDAVAADVAAVVLTGGTGLTGRDVTPEAVEPLFSRRLDGFGELFRSLSYAEIGSAAMLSRACAGLVGRTLVFALPGSTGACRLAVEKLVAPELRHLAHLVRTDRPAGSRGELAPPPPAALAATADEPTVDAEFSEEGLPAPTGAFGNLGASRLELGLQPSPHEAAPPVAGAEAGGWLRAVHDLRGAVLRDQREELPEAIGKLAPVVNVLEQAGESAVLELDGRRFSLWGLPDLRRPGSKVLAVAPGEPLAEVLALHRHPITTGTCVEGTGGRCPSRSAPLGEVAEAVTGRAPPGEPGPLFAVSGDAIWFERRGRVIRWDGAREREEGTPRQALASLVLEWSQR